LENYGDGMTVTRLAKFLNGAALNEANKKQITTS